MFSMVDSDRAMQESGQGTGDRNTGKQKLLLKGGGHGGPTEKVISQ